MSFSSFVNFLFLFTHTTFYDGIHYGCSTFFISAVFFLPSTQEKQKMKILPTDTMMHTFIFIFSTNGVGQITYSDYKIRFSLLLNKHTFFIQVILMLSYDRYRVCYLNHFIYVKLGFPRKIVQHEGQ